MNNTDKTREALKLLRPDLPDDIVDMCVFTHNNIKLAGLCTSKGQDLAAPRKEAKK